MKIKTLKYDLLPVISMWFRQFGTVIANGCFDFAFYRGEIYGDEFEPDVIHLDLLVSDDEGRLLKKQVSYDIANKVVYYSRGINFTNEGEFMTAFDLLLDRLNKLPNLSRIFFDFGSRVYAGRIFDSRHEPGTYVLLLICNINTEHTLCLSDSTIPGLLTKDWGNITNVGNL